MIPKTKSLKPGTDPFKRCLKNLLPAFFLFYLLLPLLPSKPTITRGDFKKNIILTGSIQAQKAERFLVPATDRWQLPIKWMAKEGTSINPGDPVVRFDTASISTDLENAQASLELKQKELTQKKADLQYQTFELNLSVKQTEIEVKKREIDASIPKEITSKYDYDRVQAELERSKQLLKSTQELRNLKLAELNSQMKTIAIDIDQKKSELEKLEQQISQLNLVSKTKGTMMYGTHDWTGIKIQVGMNVFPGMCVASIPDVDSLYIEAWINESIAGKVKPGQKVIFTLDGYPDSKSKRTGTITNVFSNAELKKLWSRAYYFKVNISMDKPDTALMKPGMSVKCMIESAHYPDVLLVPIEMAYFDGQYFWVKPGGKEPLKVNHLDFNEFFLAINPNSTGSKWVEEKTTLEPVDPSQLHTNGNNRKGEKKSETH